VDTQDQPTGPAVGNVVIWCDTVNDREYPAIVYDAAGDQLTLAVICRDRQGRLVLGEVTTGPDDPECYWRWPSYGGSLVPADPPSTAGVSGAELVASGPGGI
jgi:hypothetical protein